jgi:hypothetical protein
VLCWWTLTLVAWEGWPKEERVHLGEELSDVLLYLVRLAGAVVLRSIAATVDIRS